MQAMPFIRLLIAKKDDLICDNSTIVAYLKPTAEA